MGSSSRSKVFDPIRKNAFAAGPEEKVRQALIRDMIERLGFPRELFAVEKDLRNLPHLASVRSPKRRADIICFAKDIHPEHALYPLLLIECKDEELDDKALDQALGYNHYVQAYFVGIANASAIRLKFFDSAARTLAFLPTYQELLCAVKK